MPSDPTAPPRERFVLRLSSESDLYFVCRTGIGPMTGPLGEAARYSTREDAVDAMLGQARHWLCSWKIEEEPR